MLNHIVTGDDTQVSHITHDMDLTYQNIGPYSGTVPLLQQKNLHKKDHVSCILGQNSFGRIHALRHDIKCYCSVGNFEKSMVCHSEQKAQDVECAGIHQHRMLSAP